MFGEWKDWQNKQRAHVGYLDQDGKKFRCCLAKPIEIEEAAKSDRTKWQRADEIKVEAITRVLISELGFN